MGGIEPPRRTSEVVHRLSPDVDQWRPGTAADLIRPVPRARISIRRNHPARDHSCARANLTHTKNHDGCLHMDTDGRYAQNTESEPNDYAETWVVSTLDDRFRYWAWLAFRSPVQKDGCARRHFDCCWWLS